MDERTQDTLSQSDELRGLLADATPDAGLLLAAAQKALVALEFRAADASLGLVPVDPDLVHGLLGLAFEAAERAVALGSADAAVWLGDTRFDFGDPEASLGLFQVAATAGHPLGAAKFAEMVRRMERTDLYADALARLDAALPADPNGMVHYVRGLYAQNGHACPVDPAAAFALHVEAAGRGNADAMFELYAMYTNGVGVASDPTKAVEWCVRAAEGGSVRAMYNLGTMHATGNGLPLDKGRSVEWYAKAADHGHPRAAATLGCMYAMGVEIEQDATKAREFFQRADDLGYDWRPMARSGRLDPADWE